MNKNLIDCFDVMFKCVNTYKPNYIKKWKNAKLNKKSAKKIRVRCPYCNYIFILKSRPNKENQSFSGLRKTHCPYCEQVVLLPGDSTRQGGRTSDNLSLPRRFRQAGPEPARQAVSSLPEPFQAFYKSLLRTRRKRDLSAFKRLFQALIASRPGASFLSAPWIQVFGKRRPFPLHVQTRPSGSWHAPSGRWRMISALDHK